MKTISPTIIKFLEKQFICRWQHFLTFKNGNYHGEKTNPE
jgi:hypothetical protein